MEPSTWNPTNQHWLSRFLLKGFKAKGKSSLIYERDNVTGKIEPSKIDAVASKLHLLTNREDELMRDMETRSSRVVAKLRKGDIDIGAGDRLILDDLVWALWYNNPFSDVNKIGEHDGAIKHTVDRVVSAIRRHGGEVDPDDVTSIAQNALNQDYLCHAFEFSPGGPARILHSMCVTIYEPPPEEFFVIGDCPVVIHRENQGGMSNLWNEGSQLMLPVGSRHLLAYGWGDGSALVRHGGKLSMAQLGELDEYYRFGQRCRHVYGRTPDSLRRVSQLKLQWDTGDSPSRGNAAHAKNQLLYQYLEEDWKAREKESDAWLDATARLMVSVAAAQPSDSADSATSVGG